MTDALLHPKSAMNYNAIKYNRLTPSVSKLVALLLHRPVEGRIYRAPFFDPDCTLLQSQISLQPRHCENRPKTDCTFGIGVLPFMGCMAFTTSLILAFPQIALWLPDLIFDAR